MAHILVVEDEAPIRENITRLLKLEGHSVTDCSGGLAAMDLLRSGLQPDMILCDYMMPGMDGFELLQTLQADAHWRSIPFLFVSASAEPERLEEALTRGARAYVTKPFSLARLREMINQHLPGGPSDA